MAGVTKRKLKKSGKYRGWFMNADGRQEFFTGTTNPKETLAMARKFEDDHRQVRLGYREKPEESSKPWPYKETAKEYLAWGTAQGGHGGRPWSPVHVAMRTRHLLTVWPVKLNLKEVKDINLKKVESVVRELLETSSNKTVQSHVESLRAFCLWAKTRKILKANPLEGIQTLDTTPKNARRALTEDEIERLLKAAPDDRRLIYEVALCTGYRKGELAALQVRDLDTENFSLRLAAKFCKGRKDSRQPVPQTLVEKLKQHIKGKGETDPLFAIEFHLDRLFDKDLVAAKIVEDEDTGAVVFHSLRHTYCTLIIESGATLTEAQRLLRHSDPRLTANVYSHARKDRLQSTAEAVGAKVIPGPNNALSMHALAAGAEGMSVSADGEKKLEDSKNGAGEGVRTFTTIFTKTVEVKTFRTGRDPVHAGCTVIGRHHPLSDLLSHRMKPVLTGVCVNVRSQLWVLMPHQALRFRKIRACVDHESAVRMP